mgnify:CR=1 FL=1
MSKLLPALLGFACVIWISAWTVRLSEPSAMELERTAACRFTFTLTHEEFKLATHDLFSFAFSEEQPTLTDSTLIFLKKLAAYLAGHPEEKVYLTGVYAPGETNQSISSNLGIARAEAIKSILVQKGAPGDNIFSKDYLTNSLHQVGGKMVGGVFFSFENPIPGSQAITPSSGQQTFTKNDAPPQSDGRVFYFAVGEYRLSENDKRMLDDLRGYLNSDPSLKVVLTGYSGQMEDHKTGKNLAELRAMAIRRYLVDSGVRRSKIEVAAKPPSSAEDQQRIVTVTIRQISIN